jgi:hypothetical protein
MELGGNQVAEINTAIITGPGDGRRISRPSHKSARQTASHPRRSCRRTAARTVVLRIRAPCRVSAVYAQWIYHGSSVVCGGIAVVAMSPLRGGVSRVSRPGEIVSLVLQLEKDDNRSAPATAMLAPL